MMRSRRRSRPPDTASQRSPLRPLRLSEINRLAQWDDEGDALTSDRLTRSIVRADVAVVVLDHADQSGPVAYAVIRFLDATIRICRVVVDPAYRRQGIAAKLLRLVSAEYGRMFSSHGKNGTDTIHPRKYPVTIVVPEDRADLISLGRRIDGKASLVRGKFGSVDGILFSIG